MEATRVEAEDSLESAVDRRLHGGLVQSVTPTFYARMSLVSALRFRTYGAEVRQIEALLTLTLERLSHAMDLHLSVDKDRLSSGSHVT